MKIERIREFIAEMSAEVDKEVFEQMVGYEVDELISDTEVCESLVKLSLLEELGVWFDQLVNAKEPHIKILFLDRLDLWEVQGFYGYQLYSSQPWSQYGADVIRCRARMNVARQLSSRIKGAV
jgi:hypothetical protein